MQHFYRTVGDVSSGSPFDSRLFLTRPVTRSAVAEAFIAHLATVKPSKSDEPYMLVKKTEVFNVLLQMDPRASLVSFDRAWPEFVQHITRHGQAWSMSSENGIGAIQFDYHHAQYLGQRVSNDIANGAFLKMDASDPVLRHLFGEEIERPAPRMDIQGRLITTADDKLEKIATILETITAHMQRVFEDQNIAMIVAQQNKLALDDIEDKIGMILGLQRPPAKEMTMAEKIVKAATETSTGVLSAIQEGGKISLSQKANQGVVQVFHKHLGHHIPGATSPVGRKIEAIAIPSILHFGAAMLSDKVPHVDVIQRACLRAITGESKDGMDSVVEVLMPVFQEILAGEGIVGEAMKEMSKVEPQITASPAAPRLSAGEVQTLMSSLMEQMNNAKPGEPVEIRLTLPARAAEPKQLVPPFEE